MDNFSQPTCSKKAKVKQKKDRDAPISKSVVVLKRSDVLIGGSGAVLMPNTIEMALLKKPEKGQFKTGQFSRKMTKMDIRRMLVKIFPFLKHKRFYCAAAADNRTRLEFHGEPSIWDGQFIKRKIKGNSALYILMDEEKSGDTQDSTLPAQSTSKRTHDQITTQENEESEQPSKKKPGCKGAMTVPVGDAICPVAISTITSGQQKSHIPDEKNHSGVAQSAEKRACLNNATVRYQEVQGAPVSDHEGEIEGQVASNSNSSDSGYDGETDMSFNGLFDTAKPEDSSLAGDFPEIPQCEGMQDLITPELEQVLFELLHNLSSTGSAFEGEKDTFCSAEHIFRSLQNLQDAISKVTNKTNFSEALNKIASSQGFSISDNQGSGNCMFYALSEQLAAMKRIHISPKDLRQRIVQYLEMNPRLPNGTELFKFVNGYQSWDDYLRNMSADGTWGDHLILFTAANCFGTSIHVVSSLSRDHDVTISPECGDDSGSVLMLGHVNQNHYVSLLPIEVKKFIPKEGPLEGGYDFIAVLHKKLPEDFSLGKAEFEGVGTVEVQKSSPFSLSGTVPRSLLPRDVNVTFKDQTGTQCIAKAVFRYVDNMLEMVKQIVVDSEKQAIFFAKLSQGYGLLASNSNNTQVKCLGNLQHQGQTRQQQSLNILLQVFYIAAERGGQQFIEMIFSTLAGQVVFNSYKDRTPLPEDVARANGHEDLAQYLQDVNTRLSKEISSDVTSCTIDWLELVEAAQSQASVAQGKSNQQLKQLCESDDNLSEYFADAETSSCGSFDLDVYDTDSDNKESTEKEPCTTNGLSEYGLSKRPGTGEEGCLNKITVEQEEPPNNTSDNHESCGWAHAVNKMNVEAFKMAIRNIKSGGTNLRDTSEKGTTEPKGLNKVAKWEDNFAMQQSAPLDKKDKTESSILRSSPGIAYIFDEADVQGAGETSAAKPKEDGNTTVEFISKRNPSPKDIFVNSHSKPDTKDLHMECACIKNQHCEDLRIESECMDRICPCKSGMITVLGSSTFNKELPLGDLPMEDASTEELRRERLRFWLTGDVESGKLPSVVLMKESPVYAKEENDVTAPAEETLDFDDETLKGIYGRTSAYLQKLEKAGAQDKSSQQLKQPCETADDSIDYFADADVESKESIDKEPCTADGMSNQGPNKRPFTCKDVPSNSVPIEKVEPADSCVDDSVTLQVTELCEEPLGRSAWSRVTELCEEPLGRSAWSRVTELCEEPLGRSAWSRAVVCRGKKNLLVTYEDKPFIQTLRESVILPESCRHLEREFLIQDVYFAQNDWNVDVADTMSLCCYILLPYGIGKDDDDNSSHTFTRATRNFSICQAELKGSFITSKPKDSLSDQGFVLYYSPLQKLKLKAMDSYLASVGQATNALCVLILDGADDVTGNVLSNVKEEVLELLGKILMPGRNVTLVMASREPSVFNICHRHKATRIRSLEGLEDTSTQTSDVP